MGEQSNLSIGHSPGDEPGKTKTVNAESSNAWYVNMNNGNVNTNNKTNAGRVRPVSATDKPIYARPGFDSRQSLIVSTPSAVWRLVNPDAQDSNGNNSYALAA